MVNQQRLIYKYVQSRIVILHRHVSTTPLTIIRVAYKNYMIKIHIVEKITLKSFDVTFGFL